jgi:uncharacterized membrane protein YgcG
MRSAFRWLPFGFVVAAALTAVLAGAGAASAETGVERITSYDASIAVQRDGSILVTEQIVYDFGGDQRHGIIRDIPVRSRYNDSSDRIYLVDVRSVQSPDAPSQYTVHNSGSAVSIRIGDPGQTVGGEHTYILTYLVRGSLNGFADHDELYWNAIGNQWDVPIDRATVRVSAPAAVTRAACFSGPSGSASSCQQAAITDGVARFTQGFLGPREGLTVVAAIPKGVVASTGPVLRERWSLQRAFAVTPLSGGVSGGLLAGLAILAALVMLRGRDRQYSRSAAHVVGGRAVQADEAVPLARGEPAMQSAPPAGVRPGQAGTLLDGAANPRDVTGTIVDLAVRGYLRIEDDPPDPAVPDWRLVQLSKTGGLLDYEQILLDGLFEGATTGSSPPSARLSDLGAAFPATLKRAQDALYADAAARGWFTARPDRVRRRWLITGCAVFAAGAVAIVVMAASSHLGLIPVPVALAGLALAGCARWMPVRTAKGTDLARRLLGFRRYLTTAAAGQTRPGGQPDPLGESVPYAIVFACTEQWAEVTASLADAAAAPSWYRSSGPYQPGDLSSLSRSSHFFSPMHQFATTTNTWMASHAAPARRGFTAFVSSGSGFSGGGGGGGGGFSGGGGGGGGGGSW